MRPRKWVLFLAFVIFVLSVTCIAIKYKLEQNRNLEILLVRAVSPNIKGSFTLESFRIGFFSAYLRNVHVSMPSQAFGLEISSIKIGFSLYQLIKNRGNFAQAINRVILIRPRFCYSFKAASSHPSTQLPPPPPASPASHLQDTDLNMLLLKEGIVTFEDVNGDTITAITHLSGNISTHQQETSLYAVGQFGSHKKNIAVQGQLSWLKGRRHHISLRIADGHIDYPLKINQISLYDGMINGAIECTFDTNLLPEHFETHGWLRLTESSLFYDSGQQKINSLSAQVLLTDSIITFSHISARYKGIGLTATGIAHLEKSVTSEFSLTLSNILPDSLYELLPDSILSQITYIDTLKSSIRIESAVKISADIFTDSLRFRTTPVKRLSMSLRKNRSVLIIDSARCSPPWCNVSLNGTVPLDQKTPSMDINFTVQADSFPDAVMLGGKVIVQGVLSGTIDQPDAGCIISGTNIRYKNNTFKKLAFLANYSNDHIFIRSIISPDTTGFMLSGSIDSLLCGTPSAQASFILYSAPIKEILARNIDFANQDSIVLSGDLNGWYNNWSANVSLSTQTENFSGIAFAALTSGSNDSGAIHWQIDTSALIMNTTDIICNGNGTFKDNVLQINAVRFNKFLHGSGLIDFGSKRPYIHSRLTCNTDINTILSSFTDNKSPLDSGVVHGDMMITGFTDSLKATSNLRLTNIYLRGTGPFSATLSGTADMHSISIEPFSLFCKNTPVFRCNDTTVIESTHIVFNASVKQFPLATIFTNSANKDLPLISGITSGTISSLNEGFTLSYSFSIPSLQINSSTLDSVRMQGVFTTDGIGIKSIHFSDSTRCSGFASGTIPWSSLSNTNTTDDTITGSLMLEGDLLSTIAHNVSSPIGGKGYGTGEVDFSVSSGNWKFTRGIITIPHGTLEVNPFIPDKVKKYSLSLIIDSAGQVKTDMHGFIRRRPVRITSTHTIPAGYEPLTAGPFNFGMLQVMTPKNGVDLHIPGFMVLKEKGTIDFKGRGNFNDFTVSGPIDHLKLTGTWFLRDLEFTFPLLPQSETALDFDPFPYITWEMDVKPGNRRAMYFWDLTGKKNRIMRFIEAYLDLSSKIQLRGRDLDNTFKIDGTIRSFKGAAYYGRVFDRNFDVGVEFNPQKTDKKGSYNNNPLLWGSAETFADTSRYRRVKLTAMVIDPVTGGVGEKGRLSSSPTPNITFHLSSDFEERPGESEREFYRQAGLTFSTLGGAGEAVSSLGEQMLHHYLLQRWEKRIAKKLGLDVINIESSIVSNYFSKLYDRQFDDLLTEGDYLALANIGVTVGRYFFRDNLFLKARGELIPVEMMLTPEYSVGFEFQPNRYLLMDINYGFHKFESTIQHNPLLMLQLRLPIARLRKSLDF